RLDRRLERWIVLAVLEVARDAAGELLPVVIGIVRVRKRAAGLSARHAAPARAGGGAAAHARGAGLHGQRGTATALVLRAATARGRDAAVRVADLIARARAAVERHTAAVVDRAALRAETDARVRDAVVVVLTRARAAVERAVAAVGDHAARRTDRLAGGGGARRVVA